MGRIRQTLDRSQVTDDTRSLRSPGMVRMVRAALWVAMAGPRLLLPGAYRVDIADVEDITAILHRYSSGSPRWGGIHTPALTKPRRGRAGTRA